MVLAILEDLWKEWTWIGKIWDLGLYLSIIVFDIGGVKDSGVNLKCFN